MSTLLILAGVIIFLMGLLSEQLTNLQYKDTDAGDVTSETQPTIDDASGQS